MNINLFYRFGPEDHEFWELIDIYKRSIRAYPGTFGFKDPIFKKAGFSVSFLEKGQGTLQNLMDFLGFFFHTPVHPGLKKVISYESLDKILNSFREKTALAHETFVEEIIPEEIFSNEINKGEESFDETKPFRVVEQEEDVNGENGRTNPSALC